MVSDETTTAPQPSPHFSYSEINALPLNGQQAVTAISALWLRRSTAFRWLQQPIGRHLMIDVVEQVIERHQEVKNEGISEGSVGNQGVHFWLDENDGRRKMLPTDRSGMRYRWKARPNALWGASARHRLFFDADDG